VNILLVDERQDTRRILQMLLDRSRHRLERISLEDFSQLDLEAYDLVLVDGAVPDCTQQVNLLHWIREVRRRYPHLPVAVMNNIGSQVVREECDPHEEALQHTCGIIESDNGVLNMRCRLREIALGETAALMRDECERPLLEPITFEYSGRHRSTG
jgi:CheY-like chemotaxis protein